MDIKSLNMSVKTTNALIKNGISTTERLFQLTIFDVHNLRNFTVMSSKELSEKLRELKKPLGY